MRQLTLALRPEFAQRLDNFIVGDNAAALDMLRLQAHCGQPPALYLWGEAGSGRTHLLNATAAETRASGRSCAFAGAVAAGEDFPLPSGGLLCVDQAQALDPDAQAALFRAFIRARECGCSLLIAGDRPPAALDLREDVRTRIGQCLVFELHALDDEQKQDALVLYGLSRGLMLEPDVVAYLLRHGRRDLPSLLAAVDSLDELSLARHRSPSLPLLREVLQGATEARTYPEREQNR